MADVVRVDYKNLNYIFISKKPTLKDQRRVKSKQTYLEKPKVRSRDKNKKNLKSPAAICRTDNNHRQISPNPHIKGLFTSVPIAQHNMSIFQPE